MEDFITSLVREKMDFVDTSYVDGDEGNETVVRSNRILLTLGTGRTVERIAVRAQTMHLTLLLASRIMFSYYKNRFFKTREQPYDWQAQWDSILSSHERNYNPNIWACIYINGDPIFRTEPAPYMDVVERCALVTPDNYDIIHTIVEKALNQLGKTMRVTHATNVASTFHDHDERMKCGILHRIGGKSNAINFTATGGNQQNRIVHTLSTAASFLEALNLQLVVKDLQHKVRMEEITPSSVEGGKLRSAAARMMVLSKAIDFLKGFIKSNIVLQNRKFLKERGYNMDPKVLESMLKMMASDNDTDAVMGLRGVQGLLRVEGIDMGRALAFVLMNKDMLQSKAPAAGKIIDAEPVSAAKKETPPVVSGTPQCVSAQTGTISIIVPGQTAGEVVTLPGLAAPESADIALHMKDALVAATLNKSRFKLKLLDVKNGKGEIIETVLQAEYEREGMIPVRIWSNVRGEVAALATVLRRAVANTLPDLVAA